MAWRNDVGDYLVAHQKIRRENHEIWLRARKANSVQSAYRILKRALPYERIPEPWTSKLNNQHKFLGTTSQYSQDRSDPRTFARREPVPTGAVESFSPDSSSMSVYHSTPVRLRSLRAKRSKKLFWKTFPQGETNARSAPLLRSVHRCTGPVAR
jgi:hypothetical protein